VILRYVTVFDVELELSRSVDPSVRKPITNSPPLLLKRPPNKPNRAHITLLNLSRFPKKFLHIPIHPHKPPAQKPRLRDIMREPYKEVCRQLGYGRLISTEQSFAEIWNECIPVSFGRLSNSDFLNIAVSITPGCTEQNNTSGFSAARYSTSFACEALDDMYDERPFHVGGKTQPAAPTVRTAAPGRALGRNACVAMTMDFTFV